MEPKRVNSKKSMADFKKIPKITTKINDNTKISEFFQHKNSKIKIEPVKNESKNSNLESKPLKIIDLGLKEKEDKKKKELSLLNKNINHQNESSRDKFKKIIFPIFINTTIGQYQTLKTKDVISLDNEMFKEVKLTEIEDHNGNLILNWNNQKIGYIYREISSILKCSLAFPLKISCYLISGTNFNLIMKIELERKKYIIEEIRLNEINYNFYGFNQSFDIPIELVLTLNNIHGKSVNKNEYELFEFFQKFKNFDFLKSLDIENTEGLKLEETDLIDKTKQNSEFIDKDLSLENEKKGEKDKYLLKSTLNIVDNALNCEYLLHENEKLILQNFLINTNDEDKLQIIKIFKSKKTWFNRKNQSNQDNLEKLINLGYFSDSKILFQEEFLDYDKIFTFLYNLNSSDFKYVSDEIKKLVKVKNSIKNEDNDFSLLNHIFINNPFYRLNFNKDNQSEIYNFFKESSKILTKYNFEQLNLNQTKKETENDAWKRLSKLKYINNYINISDVKVLNMSRYKNKLKLINEILKNIKYYLNERSSSVMECFLMNFTKKSQDKFSVLKKIFDKLNYMVELNPEFEKAFTSASSIYFFFSDITNIAELQKNFYGYEIYEKYDNYITNRLVLKEVEKSYLKPIFKLRTDFQEFSALSQIKRNLIITSIVIAKPSEMHEIMHSMFAGIFDYLINILANSTESIYEVLSKYKTFKTTIFEENDPKLDEIIKNFTEILYNCHFDYLDDNFVSKFSIEHVSTEILTIYVQILEKMKKHKFSIYIYLIIILSGFNPRKRGFYWFRLILDCRRYLKLNKQDCLRIVKIALADNYVKTGYLIKLQKYQKLFSQNCKKNQSKTIEEIMEEPTKNFKPDPKYYKEVTIMAESGYDKNSQRRLYFDDESNQIKTVENVGLAYYEKRGYKGIHGENLILPALFNIFFWDVIYYDKVEYVFQSPYQTYPLDLFTSDFRKKREKIIEERLKELETFNEFQIKKEIQNIFEKKRYVKTVFINWNSNFITEEILVKISQGIGIKKLIKIFEEFTKQLKYVTRGMPDLFLWKVGEKGKIEECLISEVKSVNDKLSEQQNYWIYFLTSIGQKVETLHIH